MRQRFVSAAAEFCAVVRANERGTFVGSETGGAFEGNTSGDVVVVTLPETGLRLVLPLLEFVTAIPSGRHVARGGIVPDVTVTPTAARPAGHDDAVLRTTLRLIARARALSRLPSRPHRVMTKRPRALLEAGRPR